MLYFFAVYTFPPTNTQIPISNYKKNNSACSGVDNFFFFFYFSFFGQIFSFLYNKGRKLKKKYYFFAFKIKKNKNFGKFWFEKWSLLISTPPPPPPSYYINEVVCSFICLHTNLHHLITVSISIHFLQLSVINYISTQKRWHFIFIYFQWTIIKSIIKL